MAGTFPIAINDLGEAVGEYVDGSNTVHGFARAADGAFTTIDPPGSISTIAYGINLGRAITGAYLDNNFVGHGFLRTHDGHFTTFDAPGAGAASGQGTFPESINVFGIRNPQ